MLAVVVILLVPLKDAVANDPSQGDCRTMESECTPESLGKVLYLGAPIDRVESLLGTPDLVSTTLPLAWLYYPSGEADLNPTIAGAWNYLDPQTSLYARGSYLVEVVTIRGAIVQYSVLGLSSEQTVPFGDLRDAASFPLNDVRPDARAVGSISFSDAFNVGCDLLAGDYFNRDSWIELGCWASGSTDDIEVVFFRNPLGADYETMSDDTVAQAMRGHEPIGIPLLSSVGEWFSFGDFACVANRVIDDEELNDARAMLDDPASTGGLEEKVCLSLGMAAPNGIIVSDQNGLGEYQDVLSEILGDGTPRTVSSGRMDYDTYQLKVSRLLSYREGAQ